MAEQKSLMQVIEEFFADLLRGGANQTNITPIEQVVADAGYSPADLAGVDMGQAYANACGYPGVPAEYKVPLTTPNPTSEQVVRHITQVTEVHNTNQQVFNVTDNSQNIDNSVDFDVDGDFRVEGDFDFDQHNVSATGGSVAGGGDVAGATGDGSAASFGGDAAASGGVNVDASTNIGLFGRGELTNGPDGPGGAEAQRLIGTPLDPGGLGGLRPDINVNTGAGDQTNVDGPVLGSQVGSFGAGAQNVVGNTNSPVSNEGDAINFQGNQADHGAGLGIAGGDITGGYEDSSQDATTHGDYSPIQQEQDSGNAEQDTTSDPADVPN